MDIAVLGAVTIDGAHLPNRERRVLGALVLGAHEWVTPERLADAIWRDSPPPSWHKVLQNAVSRLRQRLGDGAISFGPSGYRLVLGSDDVDVDVDVDVERFEASVRRAEQEVDTDPLTAELRLAEAATLWRGEPFSDLADWAPAWGTIRRLQERRRTIDELRVQSLLGQHRVDDALAEANALVEERPEDERCAILLATALYRCRRTVEALGVLRKLRRHLRVELGLEPSPALVSFEVAILRHDPALGADEIATPVRPSRPRTSTGNLAAPLSPLVGRDRELVLVESILSEQRLVVLTGAGGIGKTRLALATADRVRDRFPAGVWFFDLAATTALTGFAAFLVDTFGFLPRAGASLDGTVLDAIGELQMLIVLDNCEHMCDAVADFAARALRRCTQLRVLATTREPLRVDGEQVIVVPPLGIETDAVDLFVERARRADQSFRDDDRESIERVCRAVDGIPLAIELAAARVRTLPLADLADRLRTRLDLLASTRRDEDDRHRTVRAAIDWSHQLLTDDERLAFARLSVFAGAFDVAAAEALVAGPPLGRDVVDVLGALVDKSMVVSSPQAANPLRVLEPLRHFAAERCDARGETAAIVERHAHYYTTTAARFADVLVGPSEIDAVRWFDANRTHLRSAFTAAVELRDTDLALRLVVALIEYSHLHVWSEPWYWSRIALELPGAGAHPLRAAALVLASRGSWQLGDHSGALRFAEDAVGLAPTGGAVWRSAQISRAVALMFLSRLEEAEEAAIAACDGEELDAHNSLSRTATKLMIRNLAGHPDPELANRLLSRAETAGPSMRALALHTIAVVDRAGDSAVAIIRNRRAVELARSSGAFLVEGFALTALAILETGLEPSARAAAHVDVMAHYLSVGNGTHLRGFGRAAIVPLVECGAFEAAAMVDGATRAGQTVLPTIEDRIQAAVAEAREHLGDAYDAAAHRGEQLKDDELVRHLQAVVAALST